MTLRQNIGWLAGMVTIMTLPRPTDAGVLIGPTAPTPSITRQQAALPGAPLCSGDGFELTYKPAMEGRLEWHTPEDPLDVDETGRFRTNRWPQIVRAVQWARRLAQTGAPVRATALMPKLKATFIEEGVPPELVWIAEVESQLDPGAESASGARGLFQFKPAAAKRFGLLTSETDDRHSPEKSARAAARYLAVLYKRFGNWHLALAGYNAGEGLVDRLLKQHHATTFAEIAPFLPEQTQDYIPRVTATLALREKVRLSALPSPTISPTWN